MPENRPSTARKVTPKTEAARKSSLDVGIEIVYEGNKYAVRMGDLNALHAQALRRQLGLSFMGLYKALQTDADIDLIAGVIWLSRLVKGDDVEYAEVAAGMGYDAVDTLKVNYLRNAEETSNDPEA